ncbi:CheR family methyltransferase [Ureibacillus aquaedulcis]|uniref:Protein-glutamate O-methyltransferase CheR n=1 Tax=Ureibacillus aquaedulcis TaxID=3058421 RepID=A0ABT8GP83_9BACL|nr:protein-glutamate O-methyltransferase CheR [Ureibacillus sp. BA0131]MDN4493224.1 protein-glutamate O-methyltransferase CheR [Ureibacillus sp. BA0131]
MSHQSDFGSNHDLSTEHTDLEVELLLKAVFRLSGYDFLLYNRSSITRRIENRMRISGLSTITELTNLIIHNEDYLHQILNDFSINVTEMFRNPSFFKAFRNEVIPKLREFPEIRIWHAGCATGEEVFSMAVLIEEEGLMDKTVIYATDMNEDVLEKAKNGVFPIHKMQAYTKNYQLAGGQESFSQYYKTDRQYAYFHKSLLKNIIFAQHNLVTDQSFNEFHIIICRNVLIYFTQRLQNQVHHLFHESLMNGGYLGLGDKETLRFTEIVANYNEVNGNERIYQKVK